MLRAIQGLESTDFAAVKGNRSTALAETLIAAVDMLKPTRIGDGVYVVSDGEDTSSDIQLSDLRNALDSGPARFFSIATAPPSTLKPETTEGAGQRFLRTIADETGGVAVDVAPQPWDLEALRLGTEPSGQSALAIIAASRTLPWAIDNSYELHLVLPAPLRKRGRVKLDLLYNSGTKPKRAELIYRHELPPCTTNVLRTDEKSRGVRIKRSLRHGHPERFRVAGGC